DVTCPTLRRGRAAGSTYPCRMHTVTAPVEAVREADPSLAMPSAVPVESTDTELDGGVDKPWLTVVWDDPVNLMSYVTFVFQRVFEYSREIAHDLTLRVHNDGRAVVSSGSRDKVENDVRKLQESGLWATMQREGGRGEGVAAQVVARRPQDQVGQ